MSYFIKFLKGEIEKNDLITIEASLQSHIMAFSAEIDREESIVINLDKLRGSLNN